MQINTACFVRVKDETLEEIRRVAEGDEEQSTLRGTIQQGWPTNN